MPLRTIYSSQVKSIVGDLNASILKIYNLIETSFNSCFQSKINLKISSSPDFEENFIRFAHNLKHELCAISYTIKIKVHVDKFCSVHNIFDTKKLIPKLIGKFDSLLKLKLKKLLNQYTENEIYQIEKALKD